MSQDPQPQTIDCLGSTVHYWEFNKNKSPTIVMFHGYRGTHHGLQQIVDALPEFHIIVPDLPGYGLSTPMTQQAHDIAGYSAFAAAFTKMIAPNATVLGHSFGTILVAKAVADNPTLTKKLILINPVATKAKGGFNPAIKAVQFYYWLLGDILPEGVATKLFRSRSSVMLASIIMAKTKDKALRRQIHKNHLDHFSDFQTRRVLMESYKASLTHCVSDYAANITVPTLLIAGEKDAITPPSGQYKLQKLLANAKLVMIPGVGHLIHYEKPKEAAQAIKNFLKN